MFFKSANQLISKSPLSHYLIFSLPHFPPYLKHAKTAPMNPRYLPICFLLFLSHWLLAARVDTVNVPSASMGKTVRCVIVVPEGYARSATRFPVLYLLHGYSGDYGDWLRFAPDLEKYSDQYKMMVVCPDGGYNSWYLDSPVMPGERYETFTSGELVSYVDENYKTIADKDHRGISGLSMGGHGALFLAFRHPDVFGAAGSTSGGVDIRPFPKNWDLGQKLGTIEEHPENWEKYTVYNLAGNVKPGTLKLMIDCGTGDFFLEVNRSLHKKLEKMKIGHVYIESPGAHNSEYWKQSIVGQLAFFDKAFKGGS
jgi:S-formylglutathione hydrolase FrmB